jgi:hypothetical protein
VTPERRAALKAKWAAFCANHPDLALDPDLDRMTDSVMELLRERQAAHKRQYGAPGPSRGCPASRGGMCVSMTEGFAVCDEGECVHVESGTRDTVITHYGVCRSGGSHGPHPHSGDLCIECPECFPGIHLRGDGAKTCTHQGVDVQPGCPTDCNPSRPRREGDGTDPGILPNAHRCTGCTFTTASVERMDGHLRATGHVPEGDGTDHSPCGHYGCRGYTDCQNEAAPPQGDGTDPGYCPDDCPTRSASGCYVHALKAGDGVGVRRHVTEDGRIIEVGPPLYPEGDGTEKRPDGTGPVPGLWYGCGCGNPDPDHQGDGTDA